MEYDKILSILGSIASIVSLLASLIIGIRKQQKLEDNNISKEAKDIITIERKYLIMLFIFSMIIAIVFLLIYLKDPDISPCLKIKLENIKVVDTGRNIPIESVEGEIPIFSNSSVVNLKVKGRLFGIGESARHSIANLHGKIKAYAAIFQNRKNKGFEVNLIQNHFVEETGAFEVDAMLGDLPAGASNNDQFLLTILVASTQPSDLYGHITDFPADSIRSKIMHLVVTRDNTQSNSTLADINASNSPPNLFFSESDCNNYYIKAVNAFEENDFHLARDSFAAANQVCGGIYNDRIRNYMSIINER